MEQINYEELLNYEVIHRMDETQKNKIRNIGILLIVLGMLNSKVDGLFTIVIVGAIIYIFRCAYLGPKVEKEKKEIKRLVDLYNNSIINNEYIELDNDSKNVFMTMSKDIIINQLELIWEPEFIYDDETKVYKVENTQVIIVNGYFEDESISRRPKRDYKIVFIDGKYCMSCIDNLICWKKSDYWSKFYTEKSMIDYEIKYKKW